MTGKTAVRKNGLNVKIEIYRFGQARRRVTIGLAGGNTCQPKQSHAANGKIQVDLHTQIGLCLRKALSFLLS
jgi:hypothetical protein